MLALLSRHNTYPSRSQWYPLDFNATGTVIAQPVRLHVGHAHRIEGDIAQFGWARGNIYTLSGTLGFDPTKETVVIITRPSSRAKITSKTSVPASSSPMGSTTTEAPRTTMEIADLFFKFQGYADNISETAGEIGAFYAEEADAMGGNIEDKENEEHEEEDEA